MKLDRIAYGGPDGIVPRLVAVQPEQNRVIDLAAAERLRLERQGATPEAARRLAAALFPPSMAAAIALGDAFPSAVEAALKDADERAITPLSGLRFLPPLDPPLLRDFSAFEQHMQNMAKRRGFSVIRQFFQMPLYYKGNPGSLIGPEQEVPWPGYTRAMDYELELGFVIGRSGRNLTPEEARAHLFGVTILDDFSARDIQSEEVGSGFGFAKAKDFATALGPWITTTDELDLDDLRMTVRVNGEEWSSGSSGTMTWNVDELIAYASKGETLIPGELMGSGTVGFGSAAELGRQLQPGDVVEMEVQGIGLLRNRMGTPEPERWSPEPRPRSEE